jgi:ABC-type uncharacterized transport system substrate-binding protein
VRLHPFHSGFAGTLAALLGLFTGMATASAHPHVWVTVETEILHDAQKNVTGFQHNWTFDEFYTSFAIQGLDKNNDGKYDREELKELAEVNVTSLKEFGFFTFPKLTGHDLPLLEPRDYWLEYKDSMLTLHFTLPLKDPVPRAKLKDFHFAVYDPTFYVAFAFAKDNAIRLADGLPECKAEISRPEAQTPQKSLSESLFSSNNALMNFGQQYAENVRLKCGVPQAAERTTH